MLSIPPTGEAVPKIGLLYPALKNLTIFSGEGFVKKPEVLLKKHSESFRMLLAYDGMLREALGA